MARLTESLVKLKNCSNQLEIITVLHAAPLLMNVKPSSLFCIPKSPKEYRLWSIELESAGLSIYPLHACRENISVFLYNAANLTNALSCAKAKKVLETYGYSDNQCLTQKLKKLKTRFMDYKKGGDYPHEVGVFLGYPTEDVVDFVYGQKPCRMSKYWKVYNNIDYAVSMAKKYDRAKKFVAEQFLMGKSLSQIVSHKTSCI